MIPARRKGGRLARHRGDGAMFCRAPLRYAAIERLPQNAKDARIRRCGAGESRVSVRQRQACCGAGNVVAAASLRKTQGALAHNESERRDDVWCAWRRRIGKSRRWRTRAWRAARRRIAGHLALTYAAARAKATHARPGRDARAARHQNGRRTSFKALPDRRGQAYLSGELRGDCARCGNSRNRRAVSIVCPADRGYSLGEPVADVNPLTSFMPIFHWAYLSYSALRRSSLFSRNCCRHYDLMLVICAVGYDIYYR